MCAADPHRTFNRDQPTLIADGHVADEVYAEVRPHFTEKELADLTLAVVRINGWNRLAIASRTEPGKYQPAPGVHELRRPREH